MIGKTFVRLLGAFVCVAVVSAGWDAEAAHWRHRRCCAPACCYDPCCTPVYETVVTPSCCGTVASCCAPVSYTVVHEAVIAPAACCASSATGQEKVVAEKPATSSPTLASTTR